ncbi:MAG: zinc-binding dehydrogenase [Paracoccaceae bacterium]|nr:zinc-binding dehydrogenase [Paracoccaceae bacterium]
MRAAVLRAFRENLVIEDVPDPECPEDGVVVRVLACGICRSDWHGWVGEHPLVKLGHIGGHEYCGEVVAAGPRARFTVGDRVIAPFMLSCGECHQCRSGESNTCTDQIVTGFSRQGAFAEMVAVPRDHNLVALPEDMSPVLAAALGCRVTTAWHALTGRASLRPGEWLAIHGTGGIGLAALLLGRALGARVIVTDVVPEKLEHAKSLGADHAFDARDDDSSEAIRSVTNGGADVSVEALGLPQTQAASIACLGPLGRHVQVGMPVGHHATQAVDLNAVYMKNLALYGTRGMPSHRYPSLLELIAGGHVDLSPIVAREVRLSDTGRELAAFDGPMTPGVAVITDFAA